MRNIAEKQNLSLFYFKYKKNLRAILFYPINLYGKQ